VVDNPLNVLVLLANNEVCAKLAETAKEAVTGTNVIDVAADAVTAKLDVSALLDDTANDAVVANDEVTARDEVTANDAVVANDAETPDRLLICVELDSMPTGILLNPV
jgi:hypothetical protein